MYYLLLFLSTFFSLSAGKRIHEGTSVDDIEYVFLYATYYTADYAEMNLSYQELETLDGLLPTHLEYITHLTVSHNYLIDLYALTKMHSYNLTHIDASHNQLKKENLLEDLRLICDNYPYLTSINLKNNLLSSSIKRKARKLVNSKNISLIL